MEEPIKVLDAKITIRSSLSFLTDVKKKLDQPGNEKRKTLFWATKFGIWLDLPAFANDNHLLNYIFHHQVYAEPSVECPPISYRICCNTFEFGRQEFCLITGFLFGKLPKEESYKGADIAKISRKRLKPGKHEHGNGRAHKEPGECYLKSTMVNSTKHGRAHMDFYWLILNMPELVDSSLSLLCLCLAKALRKNERDSKKDKDKSVEPPKKKIKVGKVSKNKNKSVEASFREDE
ncbi:hypothetical protein Tco_0559496 [Tanacetum coccineum]